jgi:hypothetical protein
MNGDLRGTASYVAAALFIFAGAAIGTWLYVRTRPSDTERERRRRLGVNSVGRMADGIVSDIHDGVVFYSYSVSGVDYATSQNVKDLADFIPADPFLIVGPATIKYVSRNPANSIVVCETWSGFRAKTERNSQA